MDGQLVSTMNGAPLFYGKYYEMWKARMRAHLMETRCDVWYSIVTGYTPPKKVKDTTQKEEKKNNYMAIETILDGLLDFVIIVKFRSIGRGFSIFGEGINQTKCQIYWQGC